MHTDSSVDNIKVPVPDRLIYVSFVRVVIHIWYTFAVCFCGATGAA